MSEQSCIDRRELLAQGLRGGATLALLGAAGGLLAGCSSPPNPSTGLGLFTFQFNWINNVSWSSSYLAKELGVYQAHGFDQGVNFLYGGPNIAVEPVIVAGKANMGFCNSETFAAAIRQGAPLKAIGAYLQINPFVIVSLANRRPINSPQELIGKRIGVQALNDALWSALLRINKIDESEVTKVAVQFDPSPLTTGELDGWLGFSSGTPTIPLQLAGYNVVTMPLADYGMSLYQQLYVVTDDVLKDHRDVVVAGLTSELVGKQLLLTHKEQALQYSLTKYSKDLKQDPEFARRAQEAQISLSLSQATQAHGIGYMSPDDVAKNVATLTQLGLAIPPTSYTTQILDEIYADGLTLR